MIKISKLSLVLAVFATTCTATMARAQTPAGTFAQLDAAKHGLLVKLPIRPDQRDAFLEIMKARIVASRQRPEVIDFRVAATADENVFLAIEWFKDRAAFATFEALPESKTFLEKVKPMLRGSVEATVLAPLP